MVVSVPEKTLEHWASIYLTYRYRSKASLWWPAHGEDIYIGNLPPAPCKAVQLELKTTTLNKKGDVHKVKIDLDQLDRYLALPHWLQPFYVFPIAKWSGTLEDATTADGVPVSELGFSRSDHLTAKQWWFANWMVALPAARVGQVLHKELSAYQSVGKPTTADLVTFSFKNGVRSKPIWADGKPHRTIRWQNLWKRLEQCGAASWPQMVRLPTWVTSGRTTIRHTDLRPLLADSREDNVGELSTWGSTGDGVFVPVADSDDDGEGRPPAEANEETDHRIAVHLGLSALRLD